MALTLASSVDGALPRGTDKQLDFQVIDESNSLPYNLTDHTVILTMSMSNLSTSPSLQKEATIVDASDGKCEFVFEAEDTEDLLVYSYYTTIFVEEDSTGSIWPVFEGKIAVIPYVLPEEVSL